MIIGEVSRLRPSVRSRLGTSRKPLRSAEVHRRFVVGKKTEGRLWLCAYIIVFSSFFLQGYHHQIIIIIMNSHPTLRILRTRLQAIHDSISHFQPPTRRPPIHDSSLDLNDTQWLQQDYIPGLRKLKDTIKIDLDVLDKVRDHPCARIVSFLTLPCHFSSSLRIPSPPIYRPCRRMRHTS